MLACVQGAQIKIMQPDDDGLAVEIGDDRPARPIVRILNDRGNDGQILAAASNSPDKFRNSEATPDVAKLRDKRAVGPLIDLLEHDEPHVIISAAGALAALAGKDDLERVWRLVAEGVIDARFVLPLLARMPPESIPSLPERSLGPDGRWRSPLHLYEDPALLVPLLGRRTELAKLVENRLRELGDSVKPAAIEGLRHGNPLVKRRCAELLARLKFEPADAGQKVLYLAAQGKWEELARQGQAAAPLMLKALQAGGENAVGVAEQLARMKEKSAVKPLRQALLAPNKRLRTAAAKALDDLGWKPADRQSKVCYLAAREKWDEIAKLGPKVLHPLMEVIAKDARTPPDVFKIVRTLGKDSLPPLREALKDDRPDVRARACRLLGRSGLPEAADIVAPALQDDDQVVVISAAMAQARLGDGRAASIMLPLMNAESRCSHLAYHYFMLLGPKGVRPFMQAYDKIDSIDPETVRYLIRYMTRSSAVSDVMAEFLEKGTPRARLLAADMLSDRREPRAQVALIGLIKDKDARIRESAAGLLGKHRMRKGFKPLTKALKDEEVRVRKAAAWALGRLGLRGSVNPLIDTLEDKDPRVRAVAAKALGRFRAAHAAIALIPLLTDEDAVVRLAAGQALQRRWQPPTTSLRAQLAVANLDFRQAAEKGAAGLAAMKPALKDKDPEIRRQALLALANVKDKRAAALAAKMLDDPDATVRYRAAIVLSAHGDPRATPLMKELLRRGSSRMKHDAVKVLGRSATRESVPLLIEAIGDESVAADASSALRKMGTQAVPELRKAVRGNSGAIRQRATWILETRSIKPEDEIEAAYRALAKSGRERVGIPIKVLAAVLKDRDSACKPTAIKRLARLKTDEAAGLLIEAMKDQDADIRLRAAKELEKLGWQPVDKAHRLTYLAARRRLYALSRLGGDAVPTLSGLLKDADVSIRHKTALALGRIDDPRALPPLTAAMTDWEISRTVASSLRRREWRPADAAQSVRLLAARRDAQALLKDWPKTRRILLADLRGKDAAVARFAFRSLICLGQADTMEALKLFVAGSSDEEILSAVAGSGLADLAAPTLRERPGWHNDFRRRRLESSQRAPGNPCRWGLWVIEERLPDRYGALREEMRD